MKTINKRVLACVVFASAALPFSSAFATNGYFAHGYGSVSEGLAGGGSALPEDAMIAATNPAGMVFVGERLDVGAAIFHPSPRSYTVTGTPSPSPAFGLEPGTYESDNNNFLVPHLAYNWMLNTDNSMGVTVYGNGGMNTEYPGSAHSADPFSFGPGVFYAGTAGVNLSQLFINGSYARKFAPNSSFGVGLIVAYQQFKATGLAPFAAYSNSPNNVTNKGTDTSTGFGLKFGVQSEVAPGISLAASYQTKTKMSKFDKYKGLFANGGEFDIPATWTLGAAWKATTAMAVTFDVQKIMYSGVGAISNPIGNFFTECNLNSLPGSGTSGCLGGSDGAGFGWQDMTVVKLGYQYASSPDMTWRVGYSKGKQPIPSSEVLFNILAPGVIEQHFTFGFTKSLSSMSALNFAAMYAPEHSVSGKNAFDSNQTIELKMKQYQLELSYDKKF